MTSQITLRILIKKDYYQMGRRYLQLMFIFLNQICMIEERHYSMELVLTT